MKHEVDRILSEAQARLSTALFGLEDLRGRPQRRRSGFHNAVVFGRMVTQTLQNLRGKVANFDDWYDPQQKALKQCPLSRYFWEARNAIEKQAQSRLATRVHSIPNTSDVLRYAQPAPPGATELFIGDQDGASGWLIRRADGTSEKYYLEFPDSIASFGLVLANLPPELAAEWGGTGAADAVETYLLRLKEILEDAQLRFASKSTA